MGLGAAEGQTQASPANKHFKQGFTRQVFGANFSIEDCCRQAVQIGFQGFDFADDPTDWPILKKYGLIQSMYRFTPVRALASPLPSGNPCSESSGVGCHWLEGSSRRIPDGFPRKHRSRCDKRFSAHASAVRGPRRNAFGRTGCRQRGGVHQSDTRAMRRPRESRCAWRF